MVISIGSKINVYVSIANVLIVIYISWTTLQRYNKVSIKVFCSMHSRII
jgi:hypothetical protein